MKQTHKYLQTLLALIMMLGSSKLVLANHSNGLSGANANFQLTLSSFDYIVINDHSACFSWSSSQEFNVEKIELQASLDSNTFVTVDAQLAANYKYGHTYYSPIVNTDKFRYFRLMITNESGLKDFSKTIHVGDASITKQDITIFPNPITSLSFNIKVPTMNTIRVSIFTKEGVLLSSSQLQGQFQYGIRLPSQANNYMNLVVQVTINDKTQSYNVLNK